MDPKELVNDAPVFGEAEHQLPVGGVRVVGIERLRLHKEHNEYGANSMLRMRHLNDAHQDLANLWLT